MSDDVSQELAKLKEKLTRLEARLLKLLQVAEEDVNMAAELQKLLHKNRLPEVQGIQCLARYISAHQISSEGFDLIATQKGREVWMIFSWTQSFGLSSILLQSLMHLQSKAAVETRASMTPSEVFNDLSASMATAKKNGGFRLMVAKIDTAHLKVSGVSKGYAPFLTRKFERNKFSDFELCQPEALTKNPALLGVSQSHTPTLADEAYQFHFSLPPGSRLYFLSSAFRKCEKLEDFSTLIKNISPSENSDLVSDLNALLMKAESYTQHIGEPHDLTCMALEVDARKLHIA